MYAAKKLFVPRRRVLSLIRLSFEITVFGISRSSMKTHDTFQISPPPPLSLVVALRNVKVR